MVHLLGLILSIPALLLVSCDRQAGGYIAASSISKNGFSRNQIELNSVSDQEFKLWGFVDHHNLYGNGRVKEILGGWWSGEAPSTETWRFNLKASEADKAGYSFPVIVPNDPGLDALVGAFLQDALAQRPTKVFLKGRIFTFKAPTNFSSRLGVYMELRSSQDASLKPQIEEWPSND